MYFLLDQLDHKFKYGAQKDNIPEDDAMEVDGSHVSPMLVVLLPTRALLCI